MASLYKEALTATVVSLSEVKLSLVKRLLLPVVLLSAIDTATFYFLFSGVVYLFLFIKLYLYTVIAITTHRLILLGPDSVSQWGIFLWRKREFRFALYVVLLIIILVPAGFASNFSGAVGFIGSLLAFWIIGRFALTFPGIAVDEEMTFDRSWKWTADHNLFMLVIVGFVPLVFFYLSVLLAWYLPYYFYFWNLFASIFLVIEIALISNAYKSIKQRVSNRQQANAVRPS